MEIKKKLPIHMVPSTIHFVDSLPLSVNGKVDRKVLVSMLSEGRL
jgi:acyl-coenzyme A synthetase/AMP-(fatty) acid ligase